MTVWSAIILASVLFISTAFAEPGLSVAIQPLGKVKAEDIACVKAGIEALYAVTVEVLPEKPLPKTAYYAPRGRYKASRLLDFLTSETPDRFDKVVGITAQDISATKGNITDWGIFGLGELGERACVVSTFRLHAGKVTDQLFQIRLVKVVNHELGHTFDLEHCPTIGCLMQDGGGKIVTIDGESGRPCTACARLLPLVIEPVIEAP